MTTEEFSNEFDTLINSSSTQEIFGTSISPLKFDEYEKSVLLTKAQEEIVISLYNGKNDYGESFEGSEEFRRYLDELVKTNEINIEDKIEGKGLSDKSVFFKLPDDLLFITYESVTLSSDSSCLDGKSIVVIPVTQDDYYRVNKNPFKCANERKALRLDSGEGIVEIISAYNIKKYIVRYVSIPSPIILTDLGTLSINKENKKTPCKLNPILHRIILNRAVQLGLASRTSSNKSSE
jgi:hypothetical protein